MSTDGKKANLKKVGLLKKFNLSPIDTLDGPWRENWLKYKDRFDLLDTKYGTDFSKVLGSDEKRRVQGVDEFAKKLNRLKREAKDNALSGNEFSMTLLLEAIDRTTKQVEKTLSGEIGEKPSLSSFGNSKRLSRKDLEKSTANRRKDMLERIPNIPEEILDDVAYCWAILNETGEMLRLLSKLDESMAKQLNQPLPENQEEHEHLLTNALREKEAKHCFPDIKALPVGILTGETFQGMTAWGWQAKDPGPGLNHGESTHRLQWFALMERFEEDLANGEKWKLTPFELFTKIGDFDRSNKGSKSNVWGSMMDSMGGGDRRPEFKKNLAKTGTKKSVFTLPDAANGLMLSLAEISDSPLPTVLKQRYDKRFQGVWGCTEKEGKKNSLVWKQINEKLKALEQAYGHIIKTGGDTPKYLWDFFQSDQDYFNESALKTFQFDSKSLSQKLGASAKEISQLKFPRDTIDNIAYRLYMTKYAGLKMPKEGDESDYVKPIEKEGLLVGKNTEHSNMATMNEEEKMKLVKELQLKSREKFGLDKK